jgi:hypothetical protein
MNINVKFYVATVLISTQEDPTQLLIMREKQNLFQREGKVVQRECCNGLQVIFKCLLLRNYKYD